MKRMTSCLNGLRVKVYPMLVAKGEGCVSPISSTEDALGSGGFRSFNMLALIGAGVAGLLSLPIVAPADEAEDGLHCPSYPWPHKGILSSYDHASLIVMIDFFIKEI